MSIASFLQRGMFGAGDPGEILVQLLRGIGAKVQAGQIERADLPASFQQLSRASLPAGVTVLGIDVQLPDGSRARGLMVIEPSPKGVTAGENKSLTTTQPLAL